MNQMKRSLCALFSALMLLALLTGCGSKSAPRDSAAGSERPFHKVATRQVYLIEVFHSVNSLLDIRPTYRRFPTRRKQRISRGASPSERLRRQAQAKMYA